MARSLSIAAYLASLGSPERIHTAQTLPPRPDGVIIWARCNHQDQFSAVETLNRKLVEDGDPIHVVATVRGWRRSMSARALPEPEGRDQIRGFLDHWKPEMAIWVRGELDPILLDEMRNRKIPSILIDATADGLENVAGGWVPGALRSLLSQFEAVMALDDDAADRLTRAGAPREVVHITGPMEDCDPPLPCNEAERQELAQTIGTRPVWLVAAARLNEWPDISRAHQEASRRAHRLLLILVPNNTTDADAFVAHMRRDGFTTTLRSEEPEPAETTQIYVVDTEEEMGLWYRIAPITYLGGSLHGGGCRDPFEAAALGSAVMYGPQVAPFQKHASRLNGAAASRLIRSGADLGPTVETLLSTDKVAVMAHAAWDITSRGADVTDKIVTHIRQRLEEMGH